MSGPSERQRAGGEAVQREARPSGTSGAPVVVGGRRRRRLVSPLPLLFGAAAAVAGASACHDSPGGPSPAAVYSLAVGAGDLQLAPAGSHLEEPLAVKVTDGGGAAVKGVPVRFRIVAGAGAALDDSAAVTDIDGVARVELTVGGTPLDTVRVFAFVPGQENRGVTLRAVPVSPPSLSSIVPASFSAGDTVLLVGTNLGDPATTPTQVFFDGIAGRVVDQGSGGGIRVIVPPCLQGGAVPVRLEVGRATAVTVTGSYVASAVAGLAELEATTVPATRVSSCINLPGDGATYLLVPNYALGTSRDPHAFVLGATGTTAAAVGGRAAVAGGSGREGSGLAQRRFDHLLRAEGQQYAAAAAANARAGGGGGQGVALAALTLGSTRTFRVYGNTSGTVFKSATATLDYIGKNVLVYVDNDSPGGGFGATDVQRFGDLFDQTLYGIDVRAFGAESDIDRNGHVIMLLSPRVNELTENDPGTCSQGIIVGFFTYYDLASKSTNSNQGEVFYSVVPDPAGDRGCPISLARSRELIPSTFIHEFQHMISYNQHVLVRGGPAESIWADEGMSHVAEELGSRYYEDKYPAPLGRTEANQLFPDSSQAFLLGDLLNAFDYMHGSSSTSVTNFTNEGSLSERGGAWLFLRWLADQKGEDVLSRIVQSGDTGKSNIARKAGEDFARLFGDFSIALYTDSVPGVARTAVPRRYRFTSRNLRQIYARLYAINAPDVTAPYPIEPVAVPLNGSVLGSIPGGTMDFFSLTTPAGSGSVALRFEQYNGGETPAGSFPGTLGAQLGVFRLPSGAATGP